MYKCVCVYIKHIYMHNVHGDIRQRSYMSRSCIHYTGTLQNGARSFPGAINRTLPAAAVGPSGPRGTRGFIFPWLRFNFTALIWLRVFVRVSNDLQRRCLCANLAPCCFSCLPVFFFFSATTHHQRFASCQWIKIQYFFVCQTVYTSKTLQHYL